MTILPIADGEGDHLLKQMVEGKILVLAAARLRPLHRPLRGRSPSPRFA